MTSFLSEKKQRSGNRLTEIRLDSDRDIIPIKSRHITANYALFIGFDQAFHSIVDTECQCAGKNYFAFYIYASGKAFLKESTMAAISHDLRSKNIIYHKVLLPLSRFSAAQRKCPVLLILLPSVIGIGWGNMFPCNLILEV